MNAKFCLIALTGLAAAAASAAEATVDKQAREARLKEVNKVLSDYGISYATWSPDYYNYYVESDITDEERDRRREACLKAHHERIELEKDKPGVYLSCATAYLYLERWAEAVKVLDAAKPLESKMTNHQRGELYVRKAEALYAQGDEPGARKLLKEFADLNLKTPAGRYGPPDWTGAAKNVLWLLDGGPTTDERKLPRNVDAKAFPLPQKAEYTESFASVKELTVKLDGVAKDDARVKLLEKKLARFGAKIEYAGFLDAINVFSSPAYELSIALDAGAPVAEKEGYELVIGARKATVRARDPQGVLWGIVSFIQCVDQEKCAVRQCRILDWPDCAERGYLCKPSWYHLEFALFNKMNSVNFQDNAWCSWNNMAPFEKLRARVQARQFKELGLTFYYGIAGYAMYPHMPLCKERTFRKHLEICKFYASCGAGVYFPFDDSRYVDGGRTQKHKEGTKSGLHPFDHEAYGSGAAIDAKYVTRLYRAVKEEYPDFKFIFCPPFYWGPDSPAAYPEDRETYLKTLGESLDPEIPAYWTGPMVKGYDKSAEQVKWWVDLTKHKPAIFQNGAGAHNLISYGVDATPWDVWHYKGFTKAVSVFHQNSNFPTDGPQLATLGDYLWNEAGYDAERSIRMAADRLTAKGVYDAFKPGIEPLAYFDQYRHGEVNASIISEKPADLEEKLRLATNAWAKASALDPEAVSRYMGWFRTACGWAAGITRTSYKPPDFLARYKKDIDATAELARREVGYDKAKGDILYPMVLTGGGEILYHTDYALPKEKQRRLGKCIRGAQTGKNAVTARFECDPFPPSGPYELILMANEDERKSENEIEVLVNGRSVFKGLTGLPHNDYAAKRITIPFDAMKRNNEFTVRNLTPGTNGAGTPWVVINYMVLRKASK